MTGAARAARAVRAVRAARDPALLGIAAAALCMAFMPDYPTEWDSVQLTLGVDRFDVTEHSPHPPGYWLYVALGRALRAATPLDAATSLSVLAALAAGATVAVTSVIGRELGGRWLALAAAAFLATSPFMLFYGATVATYTFDALVASVLVLLALRARPGSWHGWGAAAALGLGAGLRQTTLLVLGPVALVAAVRSVRSWRAAMAVAGAGAAGILAWLVPMLAEQPGDLARYREFSAEYLRPALASSSLLYGAPRDGVLENLGEATGYTLAAVLVLLPVAAVGAVLFARTRARALPPEPATKPITLLLWLVVGVSVAFVLLVHFGKGGYVLSFLPALALLLLWAASRLRGRACVAVTVLLAVACTANLQRFASASGIIPATLVDTEGIWFTSPRAGAPYRVTKPLMDEVDDDTRDFLALRDDFDPERDVLVYELSDGGYRFRHASLTLPEFTAHFAAGGAHHQSARHRRTYTARDSTIEVPRGGRAVWVLDAPLPETDALEAEGRLDVHMLSTGRAVFVSPPGVTLFGLTVIEVDDVLPEKE